MCVLLLRPWKMMSPKEMMNIFFLVRLNTVSLYPTSSAPLDRENSANQIVLCDTAGSARGTEAFGSWHELPVPFQLRSQSLPSHLKLLAADK